MLRNLLNVSSVTIVSVIRQATHDLRGEEKMKIRGKLQREDTRWEDMASYYLTLPACWRVITHIAPKTSRSLAPMLTRSKQAYFQARCHLQTAPNRVCQPPGQRSSYFTSRSCLSHAACAAVAQYDGDSGEEECCVDNTFGGLRRLLPWQCASEQARKVPARNSANSARRG